MKMSLIMNVSKCRILNSCLLKHSVYVSNGFCDTRYHAYFRDYTKCTSQSFIKEFQRMFSDSKKESSVVTHKPGNEIQTEVKYSVKETTKTVSYLTVIVLGVGLTAIFFFAIFRELFSGNSPSGIYSKAFNRCIENSRVQDALGVPIKGYGEENRLGRRRHVSHARYLKDNVEHLRMVFYLKGSRNKGTVSLDVCQDSKGNYDFRYLFVQVHDLSRKVIVIEDNRSQTDSTLPANLNDFMELNDR